MKERIKYIDHLKCIAIVLMIYGHLVGTGTNAYDIILVIKNTMNEPLIPATTQILWKLDVYLFHLGTLSARIGTVLFFIISGYLGVKSRENKETSFYVIDKVMRIWPVFLACSVVYSLFIGITQNYWYSIKSQLVTLTLTYGLFGVITTTGVVWFLRAIVTFYIILIPFNKITKSLIYSIYSISLFLMLANNRYQDNSFINMYAYDMRYICFMLTGAMLYICERDKDDFKFLVMNVGTSVIFTFVCLRSNMILNGDATVDYTVGTFLVTYCIYVLYYIINLKNPNVLSFGSKITKFISDMSMPIYLLHVPLGLGTMYIVKYTFKIQNSYIILFSGVVVALLAAYIIHIMVEVPVQKLWKKKWKKYVGK